MGLLKFELKKVFKQKKLLWLLVIISLISVGLYQFNVSQYSNIKEDERDRIQLYMSEIGEVQDKLINLKEEIGLDENQDNQYKLTQEMLLSLTRWNSQLESRQFKEALGYEKQFLQQLTQFEEQGGTPLSSLEGIQKDIVIEKNAWLIDNQLYYEDEVYPQTPHLLLTEASDFLLGILGLLILTLFFGGTITEEKEENTWATIKTQPITIWKIIVAKFISLVVVTLIYILMTLIVGLMIPYLLGDGKINMNYPQVLIADKEFSIISTIVYLIKSSILFLGVSSFAFSVVMLITRWGKNTFTVLIVTVFVLSTGLFITEILPASQSVINPFAHLRFSEILQQPQSNFLYYPLIAFGWSILCIALNGIIPESNINLRYLSQTEKPFNDGKTKKEAMMLLSIKRFEWRKLKRKTMLPKILTILLLFIMFFYSLVAQQKEYRESSYIGGLEDSRYNLQESLNVNKERMAMDLERAEENEDENYDLIKKSWLEIIDNDKRLLDKLEDTLEGYEKNNWQTLYNYQLLRNKNYLQTLEKGVGYDGNKFTAIASIEEKKWLIENKVKPVYSGEFIPSTMYSRWDKEVYEQLFVEQNTKIDNSGLFSLYLYFERYIYFVPLVIFLFLLGGGLAAEQGKKNTLNFLKTQPIAESKLFLGKLFNAKVVAVLSCISIFLVVVLVGTVFERFGDWQYPILNYDSIAEVEASDYDGHKVDIEDFTVGFHFMNLGRFLIESIVLFSFVAMFFITLSIFISLFLKREMSVLATTALIGVTGFALSQGLTEMAHLSPFTYLNIPKIINGEIATTLNNPSVNLQTGIAVLLTVTAGLVLAGYFISGRKNAVTNKNQATEELNSNL
ncbi:ABC transporter permease subunit [Proteinivorax tanatarense]|uniref:ABC transporter permease subunit n=1 Tax=Proteinivorax tanatarense TaxID=1260629 RepID=A0AAU7VLI8_9FIRM